MHTKISASGIGRKDLERDIREHAKHMLGRLRYIAHAELALKKENDEDVEGMHVCSLRLRPHEAADVLVLARGAGAAKAITGAFRRARQELLRRRRKTRRGSSIRGQFQPALG